MFSARSTVSAKQSVKGLTLLEILLGIVLMGIMTLYTVEVLKKRTALRAVKDTVSQLQALLQYGVRYHAREDEWPLNMQQLMQTGVITDLDLCSPWFGSGQDPVTSYRSPICSKKAIYYVDPNPRGTVRAKYFGVSLQLPTAKEAQRVAGLLPSAVINNSRTVTAYVSALVQPVNDKGWLTSAGLLTDKDKFNFDADF